MPRYLMAPLASYSNSSSSYYTIILVHFLRKQILMSVTLAFMTVMRTLNASTLLDLLIVSVIEYIRATAEHVKVS